MKSEEYEKQVKAKADKKKFDFINMVQVLSPHLVYIQLGGDFCKWQPKSLSCEGEHLTLPQF